MDRVLATIDRLREASEGTRRRVLFAVVSVVVLVLGAIWAVTLRAQLTPKSSLSEAEPAALPSVAEVIQRSSAALFGSIKSGLRGLILGDESPETSDIITGGAHQQAPRANTSRLPKSE